MYNIGKSIEAMRRSGPKLPTLNGTAFVFGAAPDPVVPEALLENASIVTTNASQLYLEQFGVAKPAVTFMRSNMNDGKNTSAMKLKKLEGRETGVLILVGTKEDPACLIQRELLADTGYRHDSLVIIERLDRLKIHTKVLHPATPFYIRHYRPSMGLQAILVCLAMGAEKVAVSGISFRTSGCSFSELDYARVHVEDDLTVLRRITRIDLPVFAVDEALATDSGLQVWQATP